MAQERRSGAPKYQWARFDLPGYNMPLDWMPPGNPVRLGTPPGVVDTDESLLRDA